MLNFILRRLALIVPTVIGISLCAFFFVRVLPGDPILAMAKAALQQRSEEEHSARTPEP